MHNEFQVGSNIINNKIVQANIPINQIINDFDTTGQTGFLFKQTGVTDVLPFYDEYGNIWKEKIENDNVQDADIRPIKLYSTTNNKILISNGANSWTESNISDIFSGYPYFIYNGLSQQYILDGNIQINELTSTKIKNNQTYHILASNTIGTGYNETQMNLANNNNLIQANSIDYTKLYQNAQTLSKYVLSCNGSNGFSISDSTSILPTYFCYSGASKQYIEDINVQIGTINNDKLYTTAQYCFLGNNGNTPNATCAQFVLSSKNLVDNLITGSNIIDVTKLYSASTTDSILAIDGATKQWLTSLDKSFCDNVIATGAIDTTKIESTGTNYSFFVKGTSTPTWVQIDTQSEFSNYFNASNIIDNFKLLYPHSLFASGIGFQESFSFIKNSSTDYMIVFSMVNGSYDQGCYISCIATSGTFANYFMQFDAKSASPLTWAFSFRQNSGQIGYINRSTGAYVAVSDKNRKKNIQKCQQQDKQQLLEDFQKINFCYYDMLEDSQDSQDKNSQNFGVIAQEINQIESFKNTVQKAEKDQLFLDYSQFHSKCIQALKCQNEMQQQDIQQLKEKVKLLEAQQVIMQNQIETQSKQIESLVKYLQRLVVKNNLDSSMML